MQYFQESIITSITDINAAEGYKLVWADEFNNEAPPNTANWRFEKGLVRDEEEQLYQEENAFCKNGLLIIEGRKESRPNPLHKEESENCKERRSLLSFKCKESAFAQYAAKP